VGLFDFIKKSKPGAILPIVKFDEHGARIQLKWNEKIIQLPVDIHEQLQISASAPLIMRALRSLDEVIEQTRDIGNPIIKYDDGALLLSYQSIESVRFGSPDELFGLDSEDLAGLGIPDYKPIKMHLRSNTNVKEPSFTLQLDISDKGTAISINRFKGHVFQRDKNYHLVPYSQGRLIDEFKRYERARLTPQYTTDQNYRIFWLAHLRELALQSQINIEPYLEQSEYIHLDHLRYVAGYDVNGEPVLEGVMPEAHDHLDHQFQSSLDDLNLEEEHAFLSLRGQNGYYTRVVFDENSKEDLRKLREAKSQSQDKLEEIVENVTEYFGYGPRRSIVNTFSQRVTGLIIGRLPGQEGGQSNNIDWSEGFEGNSVFIKTTDGASISCDTKPTPKIYSEIKEKLAELNCHDAKNNEDEAVVISGLGGTFSKSDLENMCYLIESTNRITIDEYHLDEAHQKIFEAQTNRSHTVTWDPDHSGQAIEIPLESMINSLPKRKKDTARAESVGLKAGDLEQHDRRNHEEMFSWAKFKPKIESSKLAYFKSDVQLRHHQAIGLDLLRTLRKYGVYGDKAPPFGALIADDMGVGKTIQALALITDFFKDIQNGGSVMVVAPVGLLKTSWLQDGFEQFLQNSTYSMDIDHGTGVTIADFKKAPKVDRKLLTHEACRLSKEMVETGRSFHELNIDDDLYRQFKKVKEWARGKIIMCSYNTLQRNSFILGAIPFDLIILDEAQNIKNQSSLQSHAARSLKTKMAVAMTGTPIENTIMDLWNIVDFAAHGFLGSREEFRNRFGHRLKDAPAGSEERKVLVNDLEASLKPLWIRRTKREVLTGDSKLPPIHFYDSSQYDESIYRMKMTPEQEELYQHSVAHFNLAKKGEKLGALRKMLDCCWAPWKKNEIIATWNNHERLFALCPKLVGLFKILDGIEANDERSGKKVILFVNLIDVQRDLKNLIEEWYQTVHKKLIRVHLYNGSVPEKSRQAILSNFKEKSGLQILIISPRSGGVGLNLVEANHVIHYTREWNPAVEKQATDRAYRIGQTRPVHVYFPTSSLMDKTRKCAEEHLADILKTKRDILDDFTLSSDDLIISEEDFADLNNQEQCDATVEWTDVSTLSPYEFEGLIAVILEKENYRSTVIGKSGDRGADVIAFSKNKNLLIQVKMSQSGARVNGEAINQIRGAKSVYENQYQCNLRLLAVTNGQFIPDAHINARHGDLVEIWEGSQLKNKMDDHQILRSEIIRKIKDNKKDTGHEVA
jgi:SNF2 family DNA or RNA helicase